MRFVGLNRKENYTTRSMLKTKASRVGLLLVKPGSQQVALSHYLKGSETDQDRRRRMAVIINQLHLLLVVAAGARGRSAMVVPFYGQL